MPWLSLTFSSLISSTPPYLTTHKAGGPDDSKPLLDQWDHGSRHIEVSSVDGLVAAWERAKTILGSDGTVGFCHFKIAAHGN